MIDIDRVTVQFGGVRPLDDLTLQLDGNIVGIVGPNGAGKTTLLNVMSGFVRATAGSITGSSDTRRTLPTECTCMSATINIPMPGASGPRWSIGRSCRSAGTSPDERRPTTEIGSDRRSGPSPR